MKRALPTAVTVAALLVATPSIAVDEGTKQWLVAIGESQQSSERSVGGVRQRGVWVARQGHCSRIGVIDHFAAAGERIDNYRVCGTRIVPVAEAVETPGSSPLFRTTLASAVAAARAAGEHVATAEGYEIRAVRVGEADAKGCVIVEAIISRSLLLAAGQLVRSCP
jgi:hypothetical protein